MPAVGDRLRALADRLATPKRILAAGWAWFLVYAFPGYMSYDSYWQLVQARGVEPVNDWHPPVMAYLWRFVDSLLAGPFGMLFIQSTAFLLGLYGVLRHVISPRAAAIVAVALLIAPPNLIIMAVIWKDSQMAGFLVAAIACLLMDTRNGRIGACALLFLATAMRYNAAAPTLPLIALLWDRRASVHWLRRYGIAACVWVGITVAAFVANGLLTEKRMHPWAISVAPVDIIGTIRHEPALDDNALLLRMTEGVRWIDTNDLRARIDRMYKPHKNFVEYLQMPETRIIEEPTTAEHRAGMTAAWKRMVTTYPRALLIHRIEVFKDQLANIAHVYGDFTNADWASEALEHKASHSRLQRAWVSAMRRVVGTPLFHSAAYLLLAFALLPLCRGQRIAFAVLVSGILHELALFFIAPAIDYRYSHWMLLATMLGTILLFSGRRRLGDGGRGRLGDRVGVESVA